LARCELEIRARRCRNIAGLVADGTVLEIAERRPVLTESRAVPLALAGVIGEKPPEFIVDFAIREPRSAAEGHASGLEERSIPLQVAAHRPVFGLRVVGECPVRLEEAVARTGEHVLIADQLEARQRAV